MQWTVNDKYASTRIDDSVVSKFEEWVRNSGVKCDIKLEFVDPYFWLTQEERDGLRGPIGPHGCDGINFPGTPNYVDNRPVTPSNRVQVNITFKMENERAKQLKNLPLKLTKNHIGNALQTWCIRPNRGHLQYCCGVYKKPGFDMAFNALKVMKPQLNESDFATTEYAHTSGWDDELVSLELFHGMDNCLKTFTANDFYDAGDSTVTLQLLAIDVNENFDYITTLLSPYTQ